VVAQASGLRWRLPLQRAVFPAQIVIALEKLYLCIKSRPIKPNSLTLNADQQGNLNVEGLFVDCFGSNQG